MHDVNSSTYTLTMSHLSHTFPYLRYKYKCQNGGGTDKESNAEESRKCIDKVIQGIGSNDNDCEHNAGDVNRCCNILGIVKSLDLHLAS